MSPIGINVILCINPNIAYIVYVFVLNILMHIFCSIATLYLQMSASLSIFIRLLVLSQLHLMIDLNTIAILEDKNLIFLFDKGC